MVVEKTNTLIKFLDVRLWSYLGHTRPVKDKKKFMLFST